MFRLMWLFRIQVRRRRQQSFIAGSLALLLGYVHAYDMLLDVDAAGFTAGFALATLLLIAAGIIFRQLFDRFYHQKFARYLGGILAVVNRRSCRTL